MTPFDAFMLWLIFGVIYAAICTAVYSTISGRYDRRPKQVAAIMLVASPLWPIATIVFVLAKVSKGMRGVFNDAYQGVREMGKS